MITTKEELRALQPTDSSLQPEQGGETPEGVSPCPSVLRIPAPPDGGPFYTRAQAAAALKIKPITLYGWISPGLLVKGQRMKLETLRAPRGRISPAALCAFLGAVNGVEVRLEAAGRRLEERESQNE